MQRPKISPQTISKIAVMVCFSTMATKASSNPSKIIHAPMIRKIKAAIFLSFIACVQPNLQPCIPRAVAKTRDFDNRRGAAERGTHWGKQSHARRQIGCHRLECRFAESWGNGSRPKNCSATASGASKIKDGLTFGVPPSGGGAAGTGRSRDSKPEAGRWRVRAGPCLRQPSAERGCPTRSAWPSQKVAEFARIVLAKRREREKFNPAWAGGTLRLRQPRSAGHPSSIPESIR